MDSESKKGLRDALNRAGSLEALMARMARSEPGDFRDEKGAVELGTSHPHEEQLHDYVQGSLSGPGAVDILKHISLCRGCLLEVIRLRSLEDELMDDDLEWAEASTVLMRLINCLREFVSQERLDFEMFNPAMAAATSLRGVSGLGAAFALGASLPTTGFLSVVVGAVSRLGAVLRKPGTKERQDNKDRSFKIGDRLLFSVSIPAGGHLLVFHYDGADRLKLVFPTNSSQKTSVFTGETKGIPGEVEGPVGLQFLKAIWTTDPVIEPTELDLKDQNLAEKALEVCVDRLGQLKPDDWREVLCEFEVAEK